MTYLNPVERETLYYIQKGNSKLTDYQLCRFLSSKMDPNEVIDCLVRIRKLGVADVILGEDRIYRWRITEKGLFEIGRVKN